MKKFIKFIIENIKKKIRKTYKIVYTKPYFQQSEEKKILSDNMEEDSSLKTSGEVNENFERRFLKNYLEDLNNVSLEKNDSINALAADEKKNIEEKIALNFRNYLNELSFLWKFLKKISNRILIMYVFLWGKIYIIKERLFYLIIIFYFSLLMIMLLLEISSLQAAWPFSSPQEDGPWSFSSISEEKAREKLSFLPSQKVEKIIKEWKNLREDIYCFSLEPRWKFSFGKKGLTLMSHRDIGVYSQISVLFDKTKNDVGVVNETFVYSIKTDRSVKVSILSSGRDAIQEEEFFKNPFEAIAFIKEKNLINFQKIHNELIFLTNPGQIKPGLEKFRQAGF